jgi:hypothetical protein
VPTVLARPILVATAIAMAFAPTAGRAAAPQKPWDQAAVTEIAEQLAKDCEALYTAFYEQPGSSGMVGTGDAGDQFRLQNKLRRIEEESLALRGALEKGKGLQETTPHYENLGELMRDAQLLLQRSFQTAPVLSRVQTAQQDWQKLVPYYGIPEPINP